VSDKDGASFIAVLSCSAGHSREIPNVDVEVMKWLKANVEKRIPRCDKCSRLITRVEERRLS
jgi:hypothetical protein